MLFFLHIPKCGGSTTHQLFVHFSQRNLSWIKVWNPKFGADVHPNDFYKYDENLINQAACISGHLSYSQFLSNPAAKKRREKGEVTIISIVRDPIDVCISLYNYTRANHLHPCHEQMRNTDEKWFLNRSSGQFKFLKHSESYENIDKEIDRIFNNMIIIPIDKSEEILPKIFSKITGFDCANKLEKRNITIKKWPDAQLIDRDTLMKNEAIYSQLVKNCSVDRKIYDRAVEMKY